MGLIGVALAVRGIPTGPALVEVVGIAGLLFGYLGARSVKRLIRNEHP
jgi:xanthosine utilization system XapX-like protein